MGGGQAAARRDAVRAAGAHSRARARLRPPRKHALAFCTAIAALSAALSNLDQVWRGLHGSEAAAVAALRAHAASRFDALRQQPEGAHEGLLAAAGDVPAPLAACADAGRRAAEVRAEVHYHVARGVAAVAAALRNVSSNQGVREVTAANYLELLGAFVAGPEHTHAFVRDCCLGGWSGAANEGQSGWLQP